MRATAAALIALAAALYAGAALGAIAVGVVAGTLFIATLRRCRPRASIVPPTPAPAEEARISGSMRWHDARWYRLPVGTNGPLAELRLTSTGLRFGSRRSVRIAGFMLPRLEAPYELIASVAFARRQLPGSRRLEFRFTTTSTWIVFECSRADAERLSALLAGYGVTVRV